MAGRTVVVTRDQLLDQRRQAVHDAGLRPEFLAELADEHGHHAAVEWLRDHGFWHLAETYTTTTWLMGAHR